MKDIMLYTREKKDTRRLIAVTAVVVCICVLFVRQINMTTAAETVHLMVTYPVDKSNFSAYNNTNQKFLI